MKIIIKRGNREISRSKKINKNEAEKMKKSLQIMFRDMPYTVEEV